MKRITIRWSIGLSTLALLVGCLDVNDETTDREIIDGVKIDIPVFLNSENNIAFFQIQVTNTNDVDICLTHFSDMFIVRYPDNAFPGLQGVPEFMNTSGAPVATDIDGEIEIHIVPGGQEKSIRSTANASDFRIELVKSDPDERYFFDLENSYMAYTSGSIFVCDQMLPMPEGAKSQALRDYQDWTGGYSGTISSLKSVPFMFE